LNCVFKNISSLRSEELFPGSESEVVQSLSVFRVLVQRIMSKRTEKEITQAIIQVPLKCNVRLQVAQSHKKETSQCSRTTPIDFYAQSQLKETSMLKDNSKRLPLLNHN